MRDIKTRAAMEQPKTRQKNAIPRTAVRISQRHYAQQTKERQTQHQRQPVEYATEQVQQNGLDAAHLTSRATQQLQRKYILHKYRAQKVRQRDMWRSTEQTAAAQHTATVPRQPAQKPPTAAMTAAQQRAKQQTQRAAQRQMLQQTKAAARKAGQRLEQMAQAEEQERYGARTIRRRVTEYGETLLTREILAGKLDPAVPVCLDYEAGQFVLRQQIPAVTA